MSTQVAQKRVERLKLSNRKFGVEIECTAPVRRSEMAGLIRQAGVECHEEGYNHTTVDYWKIVTDASVVVGYDRGDWGMEIVSPPLKGKDGLLQLKAVCKVLRDNDADVNNTCGLHVHHEVHGESMRVMRELVAFYALHEEIVDNWVEPIRRHGNNDYARSLKGTIFSGGISGVIRNMERIENLDDLSYEWVNRQTTLNCQPAYRRHTVEFRHHDATVDYADIAYWVAFTQSIVEAAHDGKFHITAGMKPNKQRMFRLAGVQPIVRWHFDERAEQMDALGDTPAYYFDGTNSEDRDEDDYYDDDEPYEDVWGDELDPGNVLVNADGLEYISDCQCTWCRSCREEMNG